MEFVYIVANYDYGVRLPYYVYDSFDKAKEMAIEKLESDIGYIKASKNGKRLPAKYYKSDVDYMLRVMRVPLSGEYFDFKESSLCWVKFDDDWKVYVE